MTSTELGRLERVPLRDAWQDEAANFTPWLAEETNIRLLGEAIFLELEVEAQEKSVGPFRADILCKEIGTERWVLVENQLEKTDHPHLGQLITYAAGLDAVTIVWVAQRFTDEHRAALDWLNDITDERFAFFGLEIELWRIGDSAVAPKFNVVCKPNDWSKSVSEGTRGLVAGQLTEGKRTQLEYWTEFKKYLEEAGAAFRLGKPQPQHWMTVALGRSGIHMNAIASFWNSDADATAGEIRAELCLVSAHAKEFYALLERQRGQLEADFGGPLTWYNPDNARTCRIYVRDAADISDRSDRTRQHTWLREHMERMQRVFRPVVGRLDLTEFAAEDSEESA